MQVQTDTLTVAPAAAMHPAVYATALAITLIVCAVVTYKVIKLLAARGEDDNGKVVSWALLKTFPSTNGVIATGLGLAGFFVAGTMVADMMGRPISQGTQTTLSFLIAGLTGIGAGQFWAKRSTDANYQREKNAAKPGTTVNANTAEVTGGPVSIEAPAKTPPPAQEG